MRRERKREGRRYLKNGKVRNWKRRRNEKGREEEFTKKKKQ